MTKRLSTTAFGLILLAGGAQAACGIEAGSVRILSNDFPALRAVGEAARGCASDTVEVTVNATKEHQSLQGPALSVDPAEYTVAVVSNDSIVPLLNEGLIRPLDDLVAAHGQDLDPTQLIRIDGRVMAVAFMANAQHLAYRADILAEAGVEPPTSYEEVLAAAEAIRAAGIMEAPLGANNAVGWDLAEEFVNMYLGHGGAFFEEGSAAPAIENEQGVAALEMMKALAAYMPADNLSFDSNATAALYEQGQIAIVNMWGSRTGGFLGEAAAPEVSANTVLTVAPTVAGGTVPATTIWWDGFTIAANVSDEDAEASFRAMVHGIQPSTATDNPDLAAWLIPGYQPTPAVAGVVETAMAGTPPYPMTPYMGLLHEALGSELADFMKGSETAEQALADASAAYEAAARAQGFLP